MEPGTLGLFVLIFFGGLYGLAGLRQINQWETALRFTLGKFTGRSTPGLAWVLPGIQRLVKIDTRICNRELFQQQVITADNETAAIDAVIYYKVVDPEKALLNVQNFDHAVRDSAKVVPRDIVGETRLDELP